MLIGAGHIDAPMPGRERVGASSSDSFWLLGIARLLPLSERLEQLRSGRIIVTDHTAGLAKLFIEIVHAHSSSCMLSILLGEHVGVSSDSCCVQCC